MAPPTDIPMVPPMSKSKSKSQYYRGVDKKRRVIDFVPRERIKPYVAVEVAISATGIEAYTSCPKCQ